MATKEIILKCIMTAVHEVNLLLPEEEQVDNTLDAVLFGETSSLDSLGLTNLIVTVEQQIETELGASITLTDESVFGPDGPPFTTIETLADYIEAVLGE